MKKIKYFLMLLTYVWLRFDLVLYMAFQKNWNPRYEFLASLFGKEEAKKFLEHRVKLVETRNKAKPIVIVSSQVEKQTQLFLKTSPDTKSGRAKRAQILNDLIYWATDPAINQYNTDSYQTRSTIVSNFLNVIFQNSLTSESALILNGLKKIVFSRVTYLGAKGEPSPVVHDAIIAGVGRLLTAHFNELVRLRDEKLEKMTKIKLIKEIKKASKDTGSLAFSAEHRQDDQYKNQFPLEKESANLLLKILRHYRFSAWPESRKRAQELIQVMEKQLGFKLTEV